MKIILCSFLCLDVLQAQETVSYGRMADCELTVQSRKQPLMAWFEWIEKEAGIRLAYNPARYRFPVKWKSGRPERLRSVSS